MITIDINFQTFTRAAVLTDGAKIHRSEPPPAAKYECFALFFRAFMDNLIVNTLGFSRDIRARLVERALFYDGIGIIRRHLCD